MTSDRVSDELLRKILDDAQQQFLRADTQAMCQYWQYRMSIFTELQHMRSPVAETERDALARHSLKAGNDVARLVLELRIAEAGLVIAREEASAARQNFLTMQGAAATLLKRAETAEASLAAAREALSNIRELNMTGEDENGHRWANSDLIEQEIVAALAGSNEQ